MHPRETELALYAGRELNWWRRLRIARHLRGCQPCREQVDQFQQLRCWLGMEPALPAGLDWDNLAAEMKANIRLGLAAGECVGAAHRPRARLRPVLVALPVLLLVLAGWLSQVWRPALWRWSQPREPVLRATAAGVELHRGSSVFTLLHPQGAEVFRFASSDGVRVRYVDAESGLVTISHVYAQ